MAVRSTEGGTGEAQLEDEGDNSVWELWMLLCVSIRLLQISACAVLMLFVFLVMRQRTLMYVPVPPGQQRSPKDNYPMYRSPKEWGLPYEHVAVHAEDGVKTQGWLIYQLPSSSEPGYTVMLFHGNAGNIGHQLESMYELYNKLKVNILAVDYRGYGDSEDGTGPCEAGLLADALGAYKWLAERAQCCGFDGPQLRADRILLFGRSLGGSVSIRLAELLLRELRAGALLNVPLPAGLILENTFTSLPEMAVQVFPALRAVQPLLRYPLLWDQWRARESLQRFAETHRDWCCCLLSGLQDEVVPPGHMRQLHEVLLDHRPAVLDFVSFASGGHDDTPQQGGPDYWRALQSFLVQVVEVQDSAAPTIA